MYEPLVVAYGMGVDSTAMLVELARRHIRPDLILFADTGGEKPETYTYLPVIQQFLECVGFPPLVTVNRTGKDASLEAECLRKGLLPSLAYGGKSCSLKWKRDPQDKYVNHWQPAIECWRSGGKVTKAIGFDAGPSDGRRAKFTEDRKYRYVYPLIEWQMNRESCKRSIESAGLPVPIKSACFFCPAMKKPEIIALKDAHPELLDRALAIERIAQPKLRSVKGLGRRYRWSELLRQRLFELKGEHDSCFLQP
jgi:hypothetical protein